MKIVKQRLFGLIGYPLGHSFSQHYFTEKFRAEGIEGCRYELFPLPALEALPQLLDAHPDLAGLNVTLPYKEKVIPYLDQLHEDALQTGAVNVIRIKKGRLAGHNTDTFGFQRALLEFLPKTKAQAGWKALVLGTGGGAKAVNFVLDKVGIPFISVSRAPRPGMLTYADVDDEILRSHLLLINATPLGMFPKTQECPPIPYSSLTPAHYLFDLVYNPATTLFLQKGAAAGCYVCNGLSMLYLQANRSWEIWNEEE